MSGTVITVASGKGGTGKTSFCVNTAVALCAQGEKVLLIDADAGLRNIDIVLGMTDSLLFSYDDVILGRAALSEAAVRNPVVKSLRVVTAPASSDAIKAISAVQVKALLDLAREHFTYILIDCPAGLGQDILNFSTASDRALIVSTADYTSLRGAQSMAMELAKAGQSSIKIVVNRVRKRMMAKGGTINIDKAMNSAGLSLLGIVPDDDDIISCGNNGKILALHSFGNATKAYYNIASRLRGNRVPLLDNIKHLK